MVTWILQRKNDSFAADGTVESGYQVHIVRNQVEQHAKVVRTSLAGQTLTRESLARETKCEQGSPLQITSGDHLCESTIRSALEM